MAEPTLKEIEQVRIDPELGTGQHAVVIDNSDLLKNINENAQLKQANDWKKYTQFLNDYETRLKNQQEIADKEVADSDREYLKSQSIDLFKDALSDPYKIYSPEFNTKLANLRANAVSSKAARDFAENNAQFIVQHPEFNTDENKAKIDDYLHNQTVQNGGRKMFTLDVPDVFDSVAYFGGLRNDPTVKESVDASYISPDKQFIHERQDTKYKYQPFLEMIRLGYDSNPKIQKKAKRDFEALPENVKRNFEDAKDYWVNFGSRHFGAYDDVTEKGKENIQANPNYLKGANLAEDIRHNKATENIDWAQLDLAKEKAKLSKQTVAEQNTWLNSFVNGTFDKAISDKKEIYTGKPNNLSLNGYQAQLSNPTLALFGYETSDTEGKKIITPPDKAVVSPDGKTITFKFYKRENGKIVRKNNREELDESKTTVVPKEEFKARVGKDLLGVKTLADEIYPYGGGAAKQTVDYNSLDPAGFKQEGSNWRYKDGTLFDGNGNVINE